MPKKNVVKNLRIGEVSFCGTGMNPHADVVLMKAEITKEQYDSGVMYFKDVLAEMELAEQLEEIIEQIMMYSRAFQSSLFGLLYNDDVKDKKSAIRTTLQQFVDALNAFAEGNSFMKSADWVEAYFSENPEATTEDLIKHLTSIKEDEHMSKELREKLEKAQKEAKDAQDALAKANRLAAMTDLQKKHYNGLDDAGKDAFLQKSAEEMDAEIKKAADADEVLVVDGNTIRKSEVSPGVFAFMKSQQAKLEKQDADIKKAKDEAIEKAAQEAGQENFPNLPGDKVVKGRLWKSILDLSEDDRKPVIEMLKAGDKAIAKALEETGHSSTTDENSAEEKLNKLAREMADKDQISFHKAYDLVLKTSEGAKLYKESLTEKK